PFTHCVYEGCTLSAAPRLSQEGGSQVVSHSTYWSDRYAPSRDVWQTRLCFLPARLPLSAREECLCPPILLRLALYRWRFRIFDLDPIRRPAPTINRAEAFAHNTLATELAGVMGRVSPATG